MKLVRQSLVHFHSHCTFYIIFVLENEVLVECSVSMQYNSVTFQTGFFLFATLSRPALGPTWCPIQQVLGACSPRVEWLGCEADHSPPSSAEIKNEWNYTFTPPVCLKGMVFN